MPKTVIEKVVLYKDHPEGPKTILYYPTSHKYKLDGEDLYGVSKTPNIIDKPGLRFYYMTEAFKGIYRELNPMNAQIFSVKNISPEGWNKLCNSHKSDFQQKNTRGTDNGTRIHEWLEQFFIALRDGKLTPELPSRYELESLGPDASYEKIDRYQEQNEWNNLVNALEEFAIWVHGQTVEVVALEEIVLSIQYKYAGRFDAILRINGKLYMVDFKTNNPSSDYPDGIFPTMYDQIGGYDVAYTEEHAPELHAQNQSMFDGHVIFNFSKKTGRFKKRFTKDNEVSLNRNWFIHTLATKRGNAYYEYTLKQEHKQKKGNT